MDVVYGPSIRDAWNYLLRHAQRTGDKKNELLSIDFGLAAFESMLREEPLMEAVLSPKLNAPILLPAHLDLFSQTWPVPTADPEVGLYLHGPSRDQDSVMVIWRADLHLEQDAQSIRRLLGLVPPRAAEAIELPIWAVRRWLRNSSDLDDVLSDIAGTIPDGERLSTSGRSVFRWGGDDDRSIWIGPNELRPGDTIVVPAFYGGVDVYGWNPGSKSVVSDLGALANEAYAGHRFAVRIAPGLISKSREPALSRVLAEAPSRRWTDLCDDLCQFVCDEDADDERIGGIVNERIQVRVKEQIRSDLKKLLKPAKERRRVVVITDLYGTDSEGKPKGVVIFAEHGLENARDEETIGGWTEDDGEGLAAGSEILLKDHCRLVGERAERFAKMVGLPMERVRDIEVAGRLHDLGKGDSRFQRWLAYGDPLGPDPKRLLAKSIRRVSRTAPREIGLPDHWRHEALSVRLAQLDPWFSEAHDQELVLWLIGTHHGYGRVFFPHVDPLDDKVRSQESGDPVYTVEGEPLVLQPGASPQSLAFEWNDHDWAFLYDALKRRYGFWELARMEAILRLADHRVSAEETKLTNGGA